MNEAPPTPPRDTIDIRQLARAIRFALVAIVLGLSYFSFRASFSIENFGLIFKDLLGGKPLPVLTQFILSAAPVFVAVSILVPIVAAGSLFLRSVIGSFYLIGALAIVTLVQFITLYHGLSAPLAQIITAMGGGQ